MIEKMAHRYQVVSKVRYRTATQQQKYLPFAGFFFALLYHLFCYDFKELIVILTVNNWVILDEL